MEIWSLNKFNNAPQSDTEHSVHFTVMHFACKQCRTLASYLHECLLQLLLADQLQFAYRLCIKFNTKWQIFCDPFRSTRNIVALKVRDQYECRFEDMHTLKYEHGKSRQHNQGSTCWEHCGLAQRPANEAG